MLPKKVYIVEDEGVVAADLEDSLKSLGYTVAGKSASAEDAIQRIPSADPDLVLMDIMLRGEMDGIEAAERLRRDHDIAVVFLTSHADNATVRNACVTQPFGYVIKPYDERELRVTMEIAIYRHEAESRLRKMERWLATTLESIGDAVIATDTDGRITFLNPMASRLTGWTSSEAHGRMIMDVFQVTRQESAAPIPNPVLDAVGRAETVSIPPGSLLRTRHGSVVPVDDSVAPIRDNEKVVGAVLVFRDCTERLRAEAEIRAMNDQLELRVKERTAELLSINKELESFSYTVAHDLRAPLRAINGFSSLLHERYAARFDAEGHRLLNVVCDSARQMGQMVDAFLDLARVGRQVIRTVSVDMGSVLKSALSEFQREANEVNLVVGPIPPVHGDPSLLRQVWANLVSNALKFTRGVPDRRIEIGGVVNDVDVVYWVRDNGVGFNMENAEQLFQTFQRLHTSTEFEGTGIGLAITRKILERHGGRISAESAPGVGTTFTFAIPSAPGPIGSFRDAARLVASGG